MNRHIAIFTQMGNGHVYPILPLCSELTARGYRVTFPVNDRYSRRVQATGAEALVVIDTPVDEALRAENQRRSDAPPFGSHRFETTALEWAHIVKSTEDLLSQVGGLYNRNAPDLVLYNRYCIAGRIMANRFQCPAVLWSPHFGYPGHTRFWDHGVCGNPVGLVAYGERLDGFLAAHGITSGGNLWHVEPANIHLIPTEFQYRSDLFDERFVFTGSLLDRPFHPTWKSSCAAKPLVLVSGYSGLAETRASDLIFFRVLIDALADLPCHGVVSVGPDFPVSSLGPLPANVQANQHTSHLEILPHAALLACHAGMGSTLEALYNGVPVLAIPGTPYTEEVAYRVCELQLGTLLSRSALSVGKVRETIDGMLRDALLLDRVRGMQQVFRRSAGAVAAAERITRFL